MSPPNLVLIMTGNVVPPDWIEFCGETMNQDEIESTAGYPASIVRYSEVRLLQKWVLERCRALPESFDKVEAWEEYRSELRDFLIATLPVWDDRTNRPAVTQASTKLGEDLIFESIDIPLIEEFDAPIHLYRLHDCPTPAPAVIVCPGYAQRKNDPDVIDMCMALARSGFIVAAVEYGGTGERADRPDVTTNINNASVLAHIIGYSNVGMRVFTTRRVLDYVCDHGGVDSDRIGITGLCQGSIISWFSASVDERFSAVALLCGATTYEAIALEYVNRQGGWSGVSPYVFNILAKGDVQHVIGCIAPRPLLVQNNLIDKHWPFSGFGKVMRFVEPIYSLYGYPELVRFRVEHAPHAFAEPFITNITEWFTSHLGGHA